MSASSVLAAPGAEESAGGRLTGKVKNLAEGAAALAHRVGELAERAAGGLGKRVAEVIEGPAAAAEWLGELTAGAAVLTDRVQEITGTAAGRVADAVVSGLLDGAPVRGPLGTQNTPLVPPAAPAPGASVPGGGPPTSGGSGNAHNLPLDELGVLVLASIVLMQGGELRPLSGSVLRPASVFLPTIERPG